MQWFGKHIRSGREDVEEKAEIDLDLDSKRWPLDLDIDNIVTIVVQNDAKKGKQPEKSYRINFAVLQRIYLRQLKAKLAEQAAALRFEAKEPFGWQYNLGRYIQALRNYEYMEKRSLETDDPFYLTGENWLDRNVLKRIIGNNADSLKQEDKSNEFDAVGYWQKGPTDPDRFRDTRRDNYRRNRLTGFYQRLGVATVAGIFLIVPMWLMVLHNTLWTALVSTTVFVVVFGVLAAWFLTSFMEVMSSTAAYAAVLVVFVGLITEMNND